MSEELKQYEKAYDANTKEKGLVNIYIKNDKVIGIGDNIYRDYRDHPEWKCATTVMAHEKGKYEIGDEYE